MNTASQATPSAQPKQLPSHLTDSASPIRTVWQMTIGGLTAVVLSACGQPNGADFFPVSEGSRWLYKVTSDKDSTTEVSEQLLSINRISSWDGKTIVVRRSEIPDNIGIEYWLRPTDKGIERIAQQVDLEERATLDERPRMVLKFPLKVGESWIVPTVPFAIMRTNENPRELKYSKSLLMTHTVERLDAEVTVPAGTFKNCAEIVGRGDVTMYADPVSGFKKIPIINTEHYCPGVGLVKLERSEELNGAFFSGGRIVMELSAYDVK